MKKKIWILAVGLAGILMQTRGVEAGEEFRFTTSQDAWVNEANPAVNYGSNTYLSLNDRSSLAEIYLKFSDADLAMLTDKTISASSLFLYQYQYNYSPGDAVNARTVLAPWDEGSVTWNAKPAYAAVNSSSINLENGNNTWREWPGLEDMVNSWITDTNYGLALENNTDGKTGELFTRFYSSEYANAEYRPYLSVATVSPEPVSVVLFLVGLGALALKTRRLLRR